MKKSQYIKTKIDDKFLIIHFYRTHKESLKKLRKLLSDSSKDIRHRRHLIQIHVTILGWLTEFMGFILIFLGSYILGHGNTIVTLIFQSLTIFIFFDVVPCIYLINDSDLKANIAETKIYFNFLRLFKSERVDPTIFDDENKNDNQIIQENAVENETKGSNKTKSRD